MLFEKNICLFQITHSKFIGTQSICKEGAPTLCVCVCVCVSERERERERVRERQILRLLKLFPSFGVRQNHRNTHGFVNLACAYRISLEETLLRKEYAFILKDLTRKLSSKG